MTIPRAASDAEKREAAQRRREAAAQWRSGPPQMGARNSGPHISRNALPDERRARLLDFPAKLRATPEKRNGQDMVHLQGHASVVDVAYEMWDFWGPYDEIIDGGAFDETLAADPDVAFLVNHRGLTMARTRPGPNGGKSTLELEMDDVGLLTDAWVNPKRYDVSDLVVAVDDGNVDQMSFAFMLDEGWWNDDFTTFKITQVDIDRGDVSAVNYGANPYTDIAARSREILANLAHMPVGIARAALRQLQERDDIAPAIAKLEQRLRTDDTVHDDVLGLANNEPRGRSIAHIEALLVEDD